VQVYVHDLVSSVTWAEKELKSYRQVQVEPGQRVVVDLELPVSACSLVNARGERVVEPGEFELLVGRSSRPRDLLAARFRVNAD
jgi:beta-glucosidase